MEATVQTLLEHDELRHSLLWMGLALLLILTQIILKHLAGKAHGSLWLSGINATLKPFVVLIVLVLLRSASHWLLPEALKPPLQHGLSLLQMAAVGWWVLACAKAMKQVVLRRYDVSISDNYHARQVHTRVDVLYRIFQFFVIVIVLALMLMTFEAVRAMGTSLLAGAGVTGIILGLAAQKTLGSIFAGIQIALTQPIKLDDAVVIEGEWGWIEEITLTYVVVRIWDLRRLVVPITYFVENPIQNWTRREAEIIGQVVIYADYRLPVDAMRVELTRLLEDNPKWNGRVNVLQVIDVSETTMTLRALMTAKDSPTAWDLRCAVREGLLTWLQNAYPDMLPRTRIMLEEAAKAKSESS